MSVAIPTTTAAARPNRRGRRLVLFGIVVTSVLAGTFIADTLMRHSGPRAAPPANAEPRRWVNLEGSANARDIGGYPTADGRLVKRGLVYRSAKLSGLTSAGVETFRKLGVKVVIDFSNRLTPWPLFGGDTWGVQFAATVRGCPMTFKNRGRPEDFYLRGVRDNAAAFRSAFEMLANEQSYPVLYHCAAGKDRTGVMTALLLALLGVDRETIMADFRLSEQVNLSVNVPAMEALLDQVQAGGGIEHYLAACGVSSATQEEIRKLLIVRAEDSP